MKNTDNPHQRHIYICIISLVIGGTEKRMTEVWNFLQRKQWTNIHLVISRPLYNLLLKNSQLEYLHEKNPSLIILECHSLYSFFIPLLKLACSVKAGSLFHYPLQGLFFVHKLFRQEVVISYNANNFFHEYTGGIKRKLLFFLRALEAKKIDILNPDNLPKFKEMWVAKDKVSLNPGSFVNTNQYASHEDKRNWIVFCGRFAHRDPKNVLKYVNAIPEISQTLTNAGLKEVRFFVLGEGPLAQQVKEKLSTNAYRNIDITLRFESAPFEIMQYSKAFISVQKSSNYPSKSLLEALSCGNLPVVTDVGETRLIAQESFAKFISEDFTSADLAKAVLEIMTMDASEFEERTNQARKLLQQRFAINEHEQYYLSLYGLNAETCAIA